MHTLTHLPVTSAAPRAAGRPLRRLGRFLREALLTLAAVGGVACVLAVGAALVLDISLLMFKTGSMAPAIPAGSVAVVRQVPASSVGVGDVVTVDRPGRLPVTHRVVDTGPGQGGATVLTLQGDANPAPDPLPYEVTTVRKVLTSFDGGADLLVRTRSPLVLGPLTLALTALVSWAFWPREDDGDDAPRTRGPGRAPAPDSPDQPSSASRLAAVLVDEHDDEDVLLRRLWAHGTPGDAPRPGPTGEPPADLADPADRGPAAVDVDPTVPATDRGAHPVVARPDGPPTPGAGRDADPADPDAVGGDIGGADDLVDLRDGDPSPEMVPTPARMAWP